VSHVVDGVTLTDSALAGIVVGAAEQVDGVRVRRRRLEIDERRVTISLGARYGTILPDAAREVQQRVVDALASMCELSVAVDVSVDDIE
jgi:uncharacterized alkaline shock family protein YloU